MNTKIIVLVLVGMVVVGGAAFYAGTAFRTNDSRPDVTQMSPENAQMRMGQNSAGGMQGRPNMMGAGMPGEIIAKDATSITVQISNTASSSDLAVGDSIVLIGAPSE